jgi:hypothetical protein
VWEGGESLEGGRWRAEWVRGKVEDALLGGQAGAHDGRGAEQSGRSEETLLGEPAGAPKLVLGCVAATG